MESPSLGKLKSRKHGESSQPKGNKHKIEIEHEGIERRLNQVLIDQLPGSGPKAR